MKFNQAVLIGGIIFLTLALILPWVNLASHTTRQHNRQQIVALVTSTQFPQPIQEKLSDYGINHGMSEQELLTLLQQGEHGGNFIKIEAYKNLHVWHLFILDVALSSKVLLVFLLVWYIVSVSLLVNSLRSPKSDPPSDSSYLDYSQERMNHIVTPPFLVTAVIFLIFFLQLPYWDTLGYVGNWAMSLLDVLVGGRVAFAPRLLVPAGLLLIMLANLESFMNGRSRKSALNTYE